MQTKTRAMFFLIIATIMLVNPAIVPGADKKGAYYTGVYENLFAELLGKNESQVKSKLDSAFSQLFFGNDSTQRVYFPDSSDSTMAYVEDIANHDVRTEGMSYGMMIAVQMDNKNVFNRIWKWAKSYMQVKSGPHEGYFAWHCRPDGTLLDSNAASDGEQWFVMSLFFASARWGNGDGIYNYTAEAQKILYTMMHKEDDPAHDKVTNMFNNERRLVVFVPTVSADGFTDPSYQLPHYYELWSRWADKDNQFWCDAASTSRKLIREAANPTTGLCPDYCNFDGTIVTFWHGGHQDFRFDAWRVAMNVAVDYEWFMADDWESTECNRLLAFFRSEGINSYGNQYALEGKRLGNDHSTGLVAMNAVAALASTSDDRKAFVEALWNARVPAGLYRYYDGMLYMLAMLQVSGNFKIYDPTGKPVPACGK
ncbi:MAG TPA: glycosyl hydrolase family 8 [Candidatus Acidoferrales bacterium]|nr:glycosyl hydrolase family 8 [Candidatus Acidoferrales bacterium]